MLSVFSTILAVLKVIPILDSWFQQLMVFYAKAAVDRIKKEDREAVLKAFAEKDQRDLEKAIGNPNPGEVSGDEGTETISGPPPGVGS